MTEPRREPIARGVVGNSMELEKMLGLFDKLVREQDDGCGRVQQDKAGKKKRSTEEEVLGMVPMREETRC